MKFTIRKKMAVLMIASYLLTTIVIVVLSTTSVTNIVDRRMKEDYNARLVTTMDNVGETYEGLVKTGMEDFYKTQAQDGLIQQLRKKFYNSKDGNYKSTVYPFVLDNTGLVIMHPTLEKGSMALKDLPFIKKPLEMKHGDYKYTYEHTTKWMTFDYFEKWNWFVGYAIPLDLMYK
jgi:hypothetical protein